jgi:hypothetical protein
MDMSEIEIASVDINQASLEELVIIRGIGPSLGQAIIEHRPYQQLDDLVRVPGINKIKLVSLKPFLRLGEEQARTAPIRQAQPSKAAPVAKLGNTEAFVFLEDRNERHDALLIIFGGFILGLIILMLRRSTR